MGTAIVGAIKSGFAIAADFGAMIQQTFTATFLETSGSTTTISQFGIVALTLTGIAIVTGIAMKVFNKFMGGKI